MQMLLALIVLIILAGGGFYWYSQNTAMPVEQEMNEPFGSSNTAPANTNTGTNTNTSGTNTGTGVNIDVDGSVSTQVREITVSNSGMTFNPKTLAVKQGERVRITFNNTGGTHDLLIEGYNVGTKVLQAGQSETFEFTANQAGEFEYYCSVGNHREMGMWGTLTVTP